MKVTHIFKIELTFKLLTQPCNRKERPHKKATVEKSERPSINNNSQSFRGHGLEKILSLLQNNQTSDESRLTVLLITMFNADVDISWLPQLRVGDLLSSHLPSSNRQEEEILLIHLLMAKLNSGPFADLWQLGALYSALHIDLVVIVLDAMCQDDL